MSDKKRTPRKKIKIVEVQDEPKQDVSNLNNQQQNKEKQNDQNQSEKQDNDTKNNNNDDQQSIAKKILLKRKKDKENQNQQEKKEQESTSTTNNNNNNNENLQKSNIKLGVESFIKENEIKDLIGKYKRNKTLIGEGAFGKIFKIQSKETNQFFALKEINKQNCEQDQLDEIEDELNILRDLDHPNILKLYEYSQDANKFLLVTELIEGFNLFQLFLDYQDYFSESNICKIAFQILYALNYVHKRNIIHRDIKFENIMAQNLEQEISHEKSFKTNKKKEKKSVFDEEGNFIGQIKILDWGTGIKQQKGQKNVVIGTYEYMAPEVLKKKYDTQCDIWSCGIVLYMLFSGVNPVTNNETMVGDEIKNCVKKLKVNFEDESWDIISDEAKDLVKKMLILDPKKRITAEKALQHPWIQKYKDQKRKKNFERSQENIKNIQQQKKILKRLKYFKTQNILQETVIQYMASHLMTNQDKEKLSEIFEQLDTKKVGKLTKQDLLKGYKLFFGINPNINDQIIQDQIDVIFQKVDKRGDGFITYNDFVSCTFDYRIHFTDQKLRSAFDFLDVEKTGKIQIEELEKVFKSELQKNEVDAKTWDQILDTVDQEGSGEISFDQFQSLMKKMFFSVEQASQNLSLTLTQRFNNYDEDDDDE